MLLVLTEDLVREMQQFESIRKRCFFGHVRSCYLLCKLLLYMVFSGQNKVLLAFEKHDHSSLYLEDATITKSEKVVLGTEDPSSLSTAPQTILSDLNIVRCT